MQFGQSWDPRDPDRAPVDLAGTVELLHSLQADIIFLQEVERVDPGRQMRPPPNFAALQEALGGFEGVFAYPPVDDEELPFGYGQAIFSRFPVKILAATALPAPDLTFEFGGRTRRPTRRVLLEARTGTDGQAFTLLNAHLQAFFIVGKSSDDFPGQRHVVADRVKAYAGPLILGGDFNSAPGEGTVAAFEALGLESAQTHVTTWKRAPLVLDHLFFSRHFAVRSVEVVPTTASDHEAIVADVDLVEGL